MAERDLAGGWLSVPVSPDPPLAPPALRVALTGGVGAGKSTLGHQLAEFGAHRIDADRIAREVVEPGSPGLAAIVARFGPSVLDGRHQLDRAVLGRHVFSDDAARADLDAILHPLIAERAERQMAAAPAGAIIVYEIPLLVETGRTRFDVVVTVEADLQLRLSRLRSRGWTDADARARIAAQASDEQRRAIADEVVDNGGTPDRLRDAASALWLRLVQRHRDRFTRS